MKFLCDQCKAKYQIADEKVQGKTLRMKCRKCGHVIEIRAAADAPASGETMQVSALGEDAAAQIANSIAPPKPVAPTPRPGSAPRPGAGAPRPAAGSRPGAAPRPPTATAAKNPPSGALASAFSKQVSNEAPPASRTPTGPDVPAEDWYVAIDEVPVGPIRLTELRAKYAEGAVRDESLVWREGYEEWRPLRTLPELHQVVKEEVSGASIPPRGSSLLPSGNTRQSSPRSSPSAPARASSPEGPAVPGAGGGGGGGQPLDGKAVETVIASKRVGVRKQCFEPWADKGNASVKVTLRIAPDGRVTSSEIASSSGEPAVGQCVQRLAKGWTFPPSEGGGTFNVPFLFGS